MPHNVRIFISHKRQPNSEASEEARHLADALIASFGPENVFLDLNSLHPGESWADEIRATIQKSDVLIVLLQKNTANSDWIQREVDMARGLNVAILPLLTEDLSSADIENAKRRLAVDNIQGLFNGRRFDPDDSTQLSALRRIILHSAVEARRRQHQWMEARQEHWKSDPAPQNLRAAQYWLSKDNDTVEIALATGDITAFDRDGELPAFDVIVNSENDYMQMARMFESTTLSAVLRRNGAYFRNHSDLLREDTLQKQLDAQLDCEKDPDSPWNWTRPMRPTEVIPTAAGHPKSRLVQKTGARYIFHAAAVRFILSASKSDPIKASETKDIVYRCFDLVKTVNEMNGMIYPESLKGTPFYEDAYAKQSAFRPIESIIFPIIATGRGGLTASEVAPILVNAVRQYLTDKLHASSPFFTIRRVYLCAYNEDDAEILKSAMDSKLVPQ